MEMYCISCKKKYCKLKFKHQKNKKINKIDSCFYQIEQEKKCLLKINNFSKQ